jgi:hypothetical protein
LTVWGDWRCCRWSKAALAAAMANTGRV